MNKVIPFDDLYMTDYNVKIINSLKQNWIIQNHFSCIDLPKSDELFLYLHSCCGKYLYLTAKPLSLQGEVLSIRLPTQDIMLIFSIMTAAAIIQ